MRNCITFLLVLFLATPLVAQQRTGTIYGKVVDTEGNHLPGVVVTCDGSLIAPMSVTTSSEGLFRFVSLIPGKDYSVRAELEGFKAGVQEGIIVRVAGETGWAWGQAR